MPDTTGGMLLQTAHERNRKCSRRCSGLRRRSGGVSPPMRTHPRPAHPRVVRMLVDGRRHAPSASLVRTFRRPPVRNEAACDDIRHRPTGKRADPLEGPSLSSTPTRSTHRSVATPRLHRRTRCRRRSDELARQRCRWTPLDRGPSPRPVLHRADRAAPSRHSAGRPLRARPVSRSRRPARRPHPVETPPSRGRGRGSGSQQRRRPPLRPSLP